MFMAVRSSGEICLKLAVDFAIGDVSDFIFSFSMSSRIFSFRRRRSSSFQSRTRRCRDGLLSTTNSINYFTVSEFCFVCVLASTFILWTLIVSRWRISLFAFFIVGYGLCFRFRGLNWFHNISARRRSFVWLFQAIRTIATSWWTTCRRMGRRRFQCILWWNRWQWNIVI